MLLLGGEAVARPIASTKTPKQKKNLQINITAPTAGVFDEAFTTTFTATISDPRVLRALLTVNGSTYEVPVSGGRIDQQIVVVPGNNRVGVVARRGTETARASTTFFVRGEATDLIVLVSWATRGEIIDLWVREPSGETCKWDHRETKSGGRLLDFSEDAIGFGSQAFVLPTARPGRYRIKVHYWSARGMDHERDLNSYQDLIERFDKLERSANAKQKLAERKDLVDRLDRWSSPAAPQTPVTAEAVLFPGTRRERRWRFRLTAQRTGQLRALGEIEITPAMIRAARTSRKSR